MTAIFTRRDKLHICCMNLANNLDKCCAIVYIRKQNAIKFEYRVDSIHLNAWILEDSLHFSEDGEGYMVQYSLI